MENNLTFWEKFTEIQSLAKVDKDKKGYKFSYRDKDSILSVIKPVLKNMGLVIYNTHDIISMENRIFIKCTAILTDGTDRVEAVGFAEISSEALKGAQLTGATMTYAERYALTALLLITTDFPEIEQIVSGIDINNTLNPKKEEKKTRTLEDMNFESAKHQFQPLYDKYFNRTFFSESDKKQLFGIYLNIVDPVNQIQKDKLSIKTACDTLIKIFGNNEQ